MVQARLDALEPTARRVLRAASIFGQASWPAGLETVMGGGAAVEIARWLPILCDRELLVARATTRLAGQPEYAFRHALVRDAVYATLTDADRALGHRLAARWLSASTDVDPLALAEHLEQAGEHEGAAAAFERAAAQALEGNDFAAVIARVQRGVAAGAAGAALGRLRLLEAQALIWRGEVAAAESALTEALSRLPHGGADRYRAIGRRAWLLAQRGAAGAIAPLFDELARPAGSDPAEPQAAELARQIALAQATAEIGMSAPLPEMRSRIEALEHAAAASGSVDVAVRPWLAIARAIGAVRLGDRGRAGLAMRAAADGFESIGDHRLACLNRINAGFLAAEVGDHAAAEAMLRAGLDAAQRMGLTHTVSLAQNNLALALFRSGRLDEARAACEAAVAQFHDLGNVALESNSLIYLADIQREAGDLALAEASARAAVQLLADVPAQRPHAQAVLARVLVRRGAGPAPTASSQRALLDEALAVTSAAMAARAAVGGLKEGDIVAVLAHAEALHAAGRAPDARDAIREARQRLRDEVALLAEVAQRETCLREVPEHRRVLELAEAWLGGEA
jgi:tetratricopeptide (TPR) repeat protein